RLEPKRQLSGIPVEENGAEPSYDRVGKRVKFCRFAFDLTILLHAIGALDDTCLGVDDRSVLQTKIDAKAGAARLRVVWGLQHRVHVSLAAQKQFLRQLVGREGLQRNECQYCESATVSHRCFSYGNPYCATARFAEPSHNPGPACRHRAGADRGPDILRCARWLMRATRVHD